MKLIQVGRRRINLKYLIMDEENDGTPETAHIPPGGVRVTLEAGKEFDLVGEEAELYRRHACAEMGRGPPAPSAAVGYPIDPATGGHRKRKAGG